MRSATFTDVPICFRMYSPQSTITWLAAAPVRALHVFLGDYIDRGPASRRTIDLLIERGRHHESIFLKGNHEAFCSKSFRDASRLPILKEYGGFQTLMSDGLSPDNKAG